MRLLHIGQRDVSSLVRLGRDRHWFAADSKLSVDFAIVKGMDVTADALVSFPGSALDLGAMRTLCDVRTKDFNDLELILEKLMQDDNQPILGQCVVA